VTSSGRRNDVAAGLADFADTQSQPGLGSERRRRG
jgi:hypothetical protein